MGRRALVVEQPGTTSRVPADEGRGTNSAPCRTGQTCAPASGTASWKARNWRKLKQEDPTKFKQLVNEHGKRWWMSENKRAKAAVCDV